MPRHDVERCVLLLASEQLPADLVDDCACRWVSILCKSHRDGNARTLPRRLVEVKACDRTLEVSGIGKPMRAQRSQVWELEVRAEDLKDVYSHFVRISLARGQVRVGRSTHIHG